MQGRARMCVLAVVVWWSVTGGVQAYISLPAKPGSAAVQAWYDELHSPGYNFSTHQSPGTGHFSQVVWMSTTHVGAARSRDGEYVVANYAPPGNYLGEYASNVRPPSGYCSPRLAHRLLEFPAPSIPS